MPRETVKAKLIRLYQEMYELTEPECRLSCRCPQSCCSPEYCLEAIRYAQEHWGTTLTPTEHHRLPLMGAQGCIAAPHLRPMCTLHTCDIGGLGFKKGDFKWTKRYFALRRKINAAEFIREGGA